MMQRPETEEERLRRADRLEAQVRSTLEGGKSTGSARRAIERADARYLHSGGQMVTGDVRMSRRQRRQLARDARKRRPAPSTFTPAVEPTP